MEKIEGPIGVQKPNPFDPHIKNRSLSNLQEIPFMLHDISCIHPQEKNSPYLIKIMLIGIILKNMKFEKIYFFLLKIFIFIFHFEFHFWILK